MGTCFVVMGFGEKTDFQSNPQRVLNLNRTYEDIIEPTVKSRGLACVRADQIIHSTVIDLPMYEQLLDADLVIADLSTSNANAIYELGVRHALRPHSTIVMAESQFKFPFDINHISILTYEHLGKEIGYQQVMKTRDALGKLIDAIVTAPQVDSPVFLFLPKLLPSSTGPKPAAAPSAPPADPKSLAELLESLKEAKKAVKNKPDWLVVLTVLNRLRNLNPDDPYIIQQTALATYKSEQPNATFALEGARDVLNALRPEVSSDAETVGLWGGIHKRLYEVAKEPKDPQILDTAIRAYARGYFIKNDYYNGINFAFLLNVRAAQSKGDDATADRVFAKRVRSEVLALCDAELARDTLNADDRFWVTASKVEALFGLQQVADAGALKQTLAATAPAAWMIQSLEEQLGKLAALLPAESVGG